MRLLRGIGAVVVALSLVVMTAPGVASASTTEHGTFTQSRGYNTGDGEFFQTDKGWYEDLGISGVWTFNVGSKGVQVGGYLRVSTKYPACYTEGQLPPCPFLMPLQAGTPWVPAGEGYTSTITTPKVTFVLTMTPTAHGVDLVIDISGCPYGWQQWVIQGESVS